MTLTIVETRPITGGVDTHADLHVAAALDPIGGLLGVKEFPATPAGYARLLSWLGNNWVICAVIVTLPFCSRPVVLPVLARLVHKDIAPAPASRLVLARQMISQLARALPGRDIHVVADAAYAGKELRRLPGHVTWTTRLRKDAALYALPGPRTGKRGRPRVKGKRLPSRAVLARTASFAPVTVHRYGKTATVQAAVVQCLWYGVFGPRPVQVVLIRDRATTGYDLALATTDLPASPAEVTRRYAARWSIEVAIEDAKQIFGAGQARHRLSAAVHRTLPFTLACQSLAVLWYATAGHHPPTWTSTAPAPPGTGRRPSHQPLT
jgi:hypothetical protein